MIIYCYKVDNPLEHKMFWIIKTLILCCYIVIILYIIIILF